MAGKRPGASTCPLTTTSTALVQAVLDAASALFSTPAVSVDTTLANPSRIVKLSGTVAAKGDALPHRPHRRAHSVFRPEAGIVSEAQLRALVALAPEARSPDRSRSNGRTPDAGQAVRAYDVPALLHGGRHRLPGARQELGPSSMSSTAA